MPYRPIKALFLAIMLSVSTTVNATEAKLYGSGQLTSSLISATVQDQDGYIWIGTVYGLSKLDGTEMTEYFQDQEEDTLLDNFISSIYCDRDNRIWVGTITGMQMYCPETDSFRSVSFEGLSFVPNVTQIIQLKSGRIWLTVSRLGVYELDCESMTAKPVDYLKELCGTDHVNCLYEDKHERVWLGTDEDGVFCLDKSHRSVTQYMLTNDSEEHTEKIAENANGVIIIAAEGKVGMFDEVRKQIIPLKQPANSYLMTKDMLLTSDGEFLIATANSGLWKIDEDTQSVIVKDIAFPVEINPTKANIVSLMEDREGNLWCGCFQRGMVMIPSPDSEDSFNFLKLSTLEGNNTSIDHGSTSSLLKDSDGRIWCGAQDGTLFVINEDGSIHRKYTLEHTAQCLFEDSNGDIWIGYENFGMSRLNLKTGKVTYVPELSHFFVKTITEHKRRTLYIGTLGNGIWEYDLRNGECMKLPTYDPENYSLLRNSYINTLYIDSRNRMWVGHFLGAACYDLTTERFLEISNDDMLNSSVGYAITETEDGSIWIGTNNGIFRWSDIDRTYTRIDDGNGLSSNMICGIVEGYDGDLWCSTFRGINRINMKDGSITCFGTSSGAASQEFIQGIFCTDGKTIYFGDGYGITRFTTPMKSDSKVRTASLTSLHIGNERVNLNEFIKSGKALGLKYNQNTFTLGFSTMSFKNVENIRFCYRLDGLDDNWYITPYGTNTVTYNHLPAGRYTLEICTEENSDYSPTQRWSIVIGKPWYSQWWAFIIYVAVLCVIASMTETSIRRHRREVGNQKKLRYYVNVAHEIRSPMVMILNPIEKLLKDEEDPDKLHTLNTIKRNSTRVIRLMNDFLDIRKLDKGLMVPEYRDVNLVENIQDTLSNFSYEAEKRNIDLVFEYTLEKMIFNVDPVHVDTIIFNLVSNALKYTPDGGEIKVNLRMSTQYGSIEITVSDTGPGIDEKEIGLVFNRFYHTSAKQFTDPRGFGIGLNLCQMLAELHNGSIIAQNRLDRSGTVFTLTLPTITDTHVSGEAGTNSVNVTEYQERIKQKKARVKNAERILIIEDDEETRLYLEEMLSPSYKIMSARDGDSGLQRALTELPDLVLTDIVMPGTNGLQILKRIKNNSNTTHIPVILLTSNTSMDDRLKGLENGADGYIVKPFNIEELFTTIDNILKNRQRIRGKFSGAHQEHNIKPIEVKGNSDKLMEKIMVVINDNLDNPDLRVEILSKEVGLSRAQLHRRMKEITGISTGEFIRNIRLKKAAELLAEKKVNISQVAYMVGFSSQTHFSTAFRKFYGISPTEYINKDS